MLASLKIQLTQLEKQELSKLTRDTKIFSITKTRSEILCLSVRGWKVKKL